MFLFEPVRTVFARQSGFVNPNGSRQFASIRVGRFIWTNCCVFALKLAKTSLICESKGSEFRGLIKDVSKICAILFANLGIKE